MKIALFTSPENLKGEIELLDEMAALPIEYIILRKPLMDSQMLLSFTEQLSNRTLNKLIVSDITIYSQFKVKGFHFNRDFLQQKNTLLFQEIENSVKTNQQIASISCHKEDDLFEMGKQYDLVFVSSIFGSISKPSMIPKWDLASINDLINNKSKKGNYFALGGVINQNVNQLKKIGFDGLGILGYIWTNQLNPLMQLNKIISACQ